LSKDNEGKIYSTSTLLAESGYRQLGINCD